jgi:hypothetical protein
MLLALKSPPKLAKYRRQNLQNHRQNLQNTPVTI